MPEYKTLEQQIIELWESRGMTVVREEFYTVDDRTAVWTITAIRKEGKGRD